MDGEPRKKKRGPPRNPHKRRTAPQTQRNPPNPARLGVGGGSVLGKQNENGVLTEQQRRFVNHVARDGMNHTAAARLAGYSHDMQQGAALIKNPKVAKAIAIEREEFARVSQMTKKKVIEGFLEAIEMARVQADPTPMIQGWTQVAKMCGFYEPTRHKLEVSVSGEVVIQKLQALDDAQLLALADGQTDVLDGEFQVLEHGKK